MWGHSLYLIWWCIFFRPNAQVKGGALRVFGIACILVAAVAGIVGHVRWPGGARAVQLCVSNTSLHAADLGRLHEEVPPGRLLPVRTLPAGAELPGGCDAIYLGSGPGAEAALPRLAGLPVVTIGEGAAFCSRGGMFCLVPRGSTPGVRLELNLDIVARSGLKVHPQVLRLGQPRAEGSGS